jgi:hypothetical protein
MLLEGNPDVRFVYKEFPTLAASSRLAAQAALAARRQSPELYTALHDALMTVEFTNVQVCDITNNIYRSFQARFREKSSWKLAGSCGW